MPRFPSFSLPAFVFALFAAAAVSAENPLQPMMCAPDKVVIQDDFSTPGPLNKQHWEQRQGTQWKVEDGVLRGGPSTPEHQASVPGHKGLEPRIAAPSTPKDFIARFSVRFIGGVETDAAPFVEFGHRVCRLRLSSRGAELLAGNETVRVAETTDCRLEPGKWYQLLAEMRHDEFVIQIAGGPTLYAKSELFTKLPAGGAPGLGFAGTRGGVLEIDDVSISTIKADPLPAWEARRAALSKLTPGTPIQGGGKAQD